jgi:transcriptional regulator with XRE-family HTH domain
VNRLKFERTQRGLSQEAVAKLAHVQQTIVSLIEVGRLIPTTAQRDRLAAVLSVPPELLLTPVRIVEDVTV